MPETSKQNVKNFVNYCVVILSLTNSSSFMEPITPMDQQFIDKLNQVIDENLHKEEFGVAELAAELGMSRVTLHRRVKNIIKKSVSQFIRETRLTRACELLRQKAGTVSEIAYQVGFNNPPYFNKCFHEHFGVTPGDVLKGLFPPKEEEECSVNKKEKSKIQWIYFLGIFVAIVVVAFFLIKVDFSNKDSENTIAFLPTDTKNLNENELIKVEAFRTNLLEELKWISEISLTPVTSDQTDLYSNNNYKKAGRKLNVNYVLTSEAFSLPDGKTKIMLNLVKARTGEILPGLRKRDLTISDSKNFSLIIEDVVWSVVQELKIVLSKEEKEKIKPVYTTNMNALKMYEQGISIQKNFDYEKNFDRAKAMNKLYEARSYYQKAYEYDTNYVCAIVKLGEMVFANRTRMRNGKMSIGTSQEEYDSILLMSNKAIRINPNYAPAYCLKAKALIWTNMPKSIQTLKDAIKADPNYWESYYIMVNNLGWAGGAQETKINTLEYLVKAYKLNPGPFGHRHHLSLLNTSLNNNGCVDEAQPIRKMLLEHFQDSLGYFHLMQNAEIGRSYYDKVIEYGEKALRSFPNDLISIKNIAEANLLKGDYKEAFYWYSKYIAKISSEFDGKDTSYYNLAYKHNGREDGFGYGAAFPITYAAFVYAKNGFEDKANELYRGRTDNISSQFDISIFNEETKMNFVGVVDCLELMQIYAATGQKEKAWELIDFWINNDMGWRNLLELSPLLEDYKDEPKYADYIKKLKRKELLNKKEAYKILENEGFIEG